jgi:hypothetical protein
MVQEAQNPLESEISKAAEDLNQILKSYMGLGSQVKTGEVQNTYFDEIFEFVNLRMESIDSARKLLTDSRTSDALTLCRPLFEQYLLFKLMCRGHKYYVLQEFEDRSEFRDALKYAKSRSSSDDVPYVRASRYRKKKLTIQYDFDTSSSKNKDSLAISYHYFLYQEQNPMSQNLKTWNYYSAIPIEKDLREALESHHTEAKYKYVTYLSFSSLKDCLKLNNLANARTLPMIDAHYSFLGQFIHPTNRVTRNLHVRSNVYHGSTGIGLPNEYTRESVLFGYIYLINLACGYLDEVLHVLTSAPHKYIKTFPEKTYKDLIFNTLEDYSYFWFLSEKPPAYDKFRIAPGTLANEKNPQAFLEVPDEDVLFDYAIYERFIQSLSGWSNFVGFVYESPLKKHLITTNTVNS